MSQGFYLEETSYRLVEQLLFATQDLAAKIEVLTQQLTTGNNTSKTPPQGEITPDCNMCLRGSNINLCSSCVGFNKFKPA